MKKNSFIIFLCLIAVFLSQTKKADALIGLNDPFGGMILTQIPCPASFNTWIIIGLPTPRSLTYDIGSMIYANYTPISSHWVLGIADAFAPCMIFIPTPFGPIPVPIGGGERVRMMGTS